MKIKRINNYNDSRFLPKVLKQHGAFEVNGLLYEIEIISNYEAIVRGSNQYIIEVIEEFRYYAEHITKFYNNQNECIISFNPIEVFNINISEIQPSQFYVDFNKKSAILEFIKEPEDIIIPLVKYNEKYVSLDGHSRLSVAIDLGFKYVKGFIADGGDWVEKFVGEANKRNIKTPYDMKVLEHEEYEIKWNQFCDKFYNE